MLVYDLHPAQALSKAWRLYNRPAPTNSGWFRRRFTNCQQRFPREPGRNKNTYRKYKSVNINKCVWLFPIWRQSYLTIKAVENYKKAIERWQPIHEAVKQLLICIRRLHNAFASMSTRQQHTIVSIWGPFRSTFTAVTYKCGNVPKQIWRIVRGNVSACQKW